jgi:hypothetical protein
VRCCNAVDMRTFILDLHYTTSGSNTSVSLGSTVPASRGEHCTVTIGSSIFVFGGFSTGYLNDLVSLLVNDLITILFCLQLFLTSGVTTLELQDLGDGEVAPT